MEKTAIYFLFVIISTKVVCGNILDNEPSPTNTGVEGRITGGEPVRIENHPYMAYLVAQAQFTTICGGAILSRRHILTSARCIDGADSVDIRIGSTERLNGGQQYTSTTFMVHPMFMEGSDEYDVGMIILEEEMDLNGNTARAIDVVELDDDPASGEEMTIAGYGRTGPDVFDALSDVLREATLEVINRRDCSARHPDVNERMFCAIDEENNTAAACEGDQGGPGVNERNLLAGIMSYGNRCDPEVPLVFTRLGDAQIRAFIMAMSGS